MQRAWLSTTRKKQHLETVNTAHCGLLEVVENALLEDEPATVLRLVLSSLLCEPALSLWVEEGLCQVPLSSRHLEFLSLHILIQLL